MVFVWIPAMLANQIVYVEVHLLSFAPLTNIVGRQKKTQKKI